MRTKLKKKKAYKKIRLNDKIENKLKFQLKIKRIRIGV